MNDYNSTLECPMPFVLFLSMNYVLTPMINPLQFGASALALKWFHIFIKELSIIQCKFFILFDIP